MLIVDFLEVTRTIACQLYIFDHEIERQTRLSGNQEAIDAKNGD